MVEGKRRGALYVLPHEAEIVRRIYRDYLAGVAMLTILRELEAEGVPTRGGGPWRYEMVRKILANPVYKGVVVLKGTEYPGRHDALVTVEEWERARQLREARRKGDGQGRGRRPKRHLFTKGMIICGYCGEAMYPQAEGDLYRCYGRQQRGPVCPMPNHKRAVIDGAVFRYFESWAFDLERTRQDFAERQGRQLAEARAHREQAEREAMKAAEGARRLFGYLKDGRVTPEEYHEGKTDQDAAEARAARLAERERKIAAASVLDAEEEMLRFLATCQAAIVGDVQAAEGVDAVRAALQRIFDHFTLRPDYAPPEADEPPYGAEVGLNVGGYWLDPEVRPEADLGWDAERLWAGDPLGFWPRYRREPLAASGNSNAPFSVR